MAQLTHSTELRYAPSTQLVRRPSYGAAQPDVFPPGGAMRRRCGATRSQLLVIMHDFHNHHVYRTLMMQPHQQHSGNLACITSLTRWCQLPKANHALDTLHCVSASPSSMYAFWHVSTGCLQVDLSLVQRRTRLPTARVWLCMLQWRRYLRCNVRLQVCSGGY